MPAFAVFPSPQLLAMDLIDRINRWRQAQTGLDEELIDRDGSAWLVSVALHFLLLLGAAFAPAAGVGPDSQVMLIVPHRLEDELVEGPEPPPVFSPALETLPEIGFPSAGDVPELPALAVAVNGPAPELTAVAGETTVAEPLLVNFASAEGAALLEPVASARGGVVRGVGNAGSVDRLTQEILMRLEDGPLLVVWLMDASSSLARRRARIIQHFDRVYEELGELAPGAGQPLLTSLAAFGQQTTFLLPEPTCDRAAIQRAVREIAPDESGVENVFTAVQQTAMRYAPFVRQGRRLMIVVVTDEKGDDPPVLEEALRLAKKQRASVYVMGPLAPFGSAQLEVKWTDPATGEQFLLPAGRRPKVSSSARRPAVELDVRGQRPAHNSVRRAKRAEV